MGFGILFIGYFIATLMGFGYAPIRLIGYGIVWVSSFKLKRYNTNFVFLSIGASIMIAVSALLTALSVTDFLYTEMLISGKIFPQGFSASMAHIERICYLVFSAALLYPIRSIAIETEVEKISFGAVRNFVFSLVYFVLYGIAYLPFSFAQDYKKYFSVPVFLMDIAIIVLNLVLIFTSYAKICDESDVDMAQKPSRFAFVNRYRAENERRREEAAQRALEKQRERAERRKNGKRK